MRLRRREGKAGEKGAMLTPPAPPLKLAPVRLSLMAPSPYSSPKPLHPFEEPRPREDSNYLMSEAQQPAWNRAKESHLLKGFTNSGRQCPYKQPETPANIQHPHLSSTRDVLSHAVLCIIRVLVRLARHSACMEVRTTFSSRVFPSTLRFGDGSQVGRLEGHSLL